MAGLAHYQAARFADAVRCYEASLVQVPDRVSTLVNLAAGQLKLSNFAAALETTEVLVERHPDIPDGWLHRGTALSAAGRHEEAAASFMRLTQLAAGSPMAWFEHARSLQNIDRMDEAAKSYECALAIDPTMSGAWTNVGGIYRESGRNADAAHAFRQAILHGADKDLNRYYLASVVDEADLGAEVGTPSAAPTDYVAALFDGYAGEFEHHLVDVLGYRGHIELMSRVREAGTRFTRAVDLGCGTGLCGKLIRPLAGHLTGVDLSAQMLELARKQGIYDRLVHGDMAACLSTSQAPFDLAVAADVLIYIGDLAPLFATVRQAMQRGGVFCFSAEAGPDTPSGFLLSPTLRYSHSEQYLRRVAAQQGFAVESLLSKPIRQDQRQAVDGLFAYLTAV